MLGQASLLLPGGEDRKRIVCSFQPFYIDKSSIPICQTYSTFFPRCHEFTIDGFVLPFSYRMTLFTFDCCSHSQKTSDIAPKEGQGLRPMSINDGSHLLCYGSDTSSLSRSIPKKSSDTQIREMRKAGAKRSRVTTTRSGAHICFQRPAHLS